MAGQRTGFDELDAEIAAIAKRSTDVSSLAGAVDSELLHAYRRLGRQIPRESGELYRALTRRGANRHFTADKDGFSLVISLRAARYADYPKPNLFTTEITKTIGEWVRHGN